MKRNAPQENTARVVVVAVAFFGALTVLGIANGVFARLAMEEVYALVAFGIGFSAATYALDDSVRAWVKQLLRRGPVLRKSAAKSPGGTRAAT